MPYASYLIVASWTAFILVWAVMAFGAKRDVGRDSRRYWLLRFGLLLVALAVIWKNTSFHFTDRNYLWLIQVNGTLADVGATITAVGIMYAIWARIHLGANWSARPALKERHELVTDGPYASVRHPIYTGMLTAILGSALANHYWFLVFFVAGAVFVHRVHVEEAMMMKEFPDKYLEYKKHTWALVPWVW